MPLGTIAPTGCSLQPSIRTITQQSPRCLPFTFDGNRVASHLNIELSFKMKNLLNHPISTATAAMDLFRALDGLTMTQCTIVGQAAVLAEGDASERKDIIFLEPLPLFFH